MVQKTVLKVDLSCLKCKKNLLKAVSSLEGVDKVEVDLAQGTLTVVGSADPYKIIVKARKAAEGKHADVVSVGPPPATAKKPEEKKGDGESNTKKSEQVKRTTKRAEEAVTFHDPLTCPECQRVAFVHLDRQWNNDHNPSCCIM